jgi:RNA polymerase sigma-70 factor (ECF subfamily)|tara:strand:+ start:1380 stop:1934 length:555 start_codon:yes stop_codon:yes gene_type:complete
MPTAKTTAESIEPWLGGAREKDPEALSKLCAYCYPMILRFMHYRVGADRAGDLAGEVILRVMHSIDKQHGRFEPWLFRIARNVIIDSARYNRARPESELTDDMAENLTDGKKTSEAAGVRLDVQAALSEASEEHREFLTLKFVQGLTNSEIGEITGQSANALRAMQFRALKAMRDNMKPERMCQ